MIALSHLKRTLLRMGRVRIHQVCVMLIAWLLPLHILTAGESTLILNNCTIHTMSKSGTIQNAQLIIESGEVQAINPYRKDTTYASRQLPSLQDAHILPAFVDLHAVSSVKDGLFELSDNESRPIPQRRYPDLRELYLRAGITTIITRPQTDSLFQGFSRVIQLLPDSLGGPKVLRDSLDFGISLMPGEWSAISDTGHVYRRMARYYRLREALRRRENHPAGQTLTSLRSGAPPFPGTSPTIQNWYTTVPTVYDIQRIQLLSNEYPVPPFRAELATTAHPNDFSQVAASLDSVPLILQGRLFSDPREELIFFLLALEEYSIDYSIASFHDFDFGCISLVRKLISYGVSEYTALAAVTRIPGSSLGQDLSLGQIEEGSSANLVVFNADPFRMTSQLIATISDGRMIWIRR